MPSHADSENQPLLAEGQSDKTKLRPTKALCYQKRSVIDSLRNHLALVMEYADDGDMSEVVDRHILKEVWG